MSEATAGPDRPLGLARLWWDQSVKAADHLLPLVSALLGGPPPFAIRCWDGSTSGPAGARATLVFRNRRALRRIAWRPDEMGIARAYVAGDLDIEGDLYAVLDMEDVVERLATNDGLTLTTRQKLDAARTAVRLGAVGLPPALPPEEVRRRRGSKHSRQRDADAISHHYDVGNDFYRLVLGPTLVYSCAYFREQPSPTYGLDDAQRDKLDLVCTKLGLQPGQRLLDVGCGWGALVLHAAQEYGVRAVGVTVSEEQAVLARKRVAEAGLTDRVEIRVQDYREVIDGPYDAIASVGMSEHVGAEHMVEYCRGLYALLPPGGRLLNHAIASIRPLVAEEEARSSFIDRYVFPDGELLPLSTTLSACEHAGFEVRDVENLREHYGLTLRGWVENLQRAWPDALALVSLARARIWLLYMAGSVLAFELGEISINQVLAVKQGPRGSSGLPLTRAGWLTPAR